MVTLPPDISVNKCRIREGGWAYNFRHKTLGELGRIVVRDAADGQSLLSCEIVGDPKDPMTEKRAAIFQPLALEISAAMEATTERGTGAVPPLPQNNEPRGVVENKILQCPRCGVPVARLVFAPEATDAGHFEDYARMLFPSFATFDMPTWIIGPDLAGGPEVTRPAEIMQVWPTRGPIRRLSPALFNPELDHLQKLHCS